MKKPRIKKGSSFSGEFNLAKLRNAWSEWLWKFGRLAMKFVTDFNKLEQRVLSSGKDSVEVDAGVVTGIIGWLELEVRNNSSSTGISKSFTTAGVFLVGAQDWDRGTLKSVSS